MDELVLKQKLKALDKRAIEYLFDTYYEPLYLFCEKFIYNSDAAHDMVQSVFIKIWENSQNITFTGTIKSYLYVSVKNECLQYLRSLNIRDAHNQKWALAHIDSMTIDNMYDSMPVTVGETTHYGVDDYTASLIALLYSFIEKLPEQCKAIYKMSLAHNYKYKEIAAKLKISESIVKVQMYRANKKIRQMYLEHPK